MIKLEPEYHQFKVILLKCKQNKDLVHHLKIKNQIKLNNNKLFIVKDLKPKRNYNNCINNQKMLWNNIKPFIVLIQKIINSRNIIQMKVELVMLRITYN